MVRKRRKAAPSKLKRNPVARALSSPLFRVKVVDRPDLPKRRPRHKKRLEDEESGD